MAKKGKRNPEYRGRIFVEGTPDCVDCYLPIRDFYAELTDWGPKHTACVRKAQAIEQHLQGERETCERRGHESSGWQAMSNPPQEICRWCGTRYRVEPARPAV